jgi:glutamine synthetase type III
MNLFNDIQNLINELNVSISKLSEVAEKRFKRDVAEAMYNTNQEHINATKVLDEIHKTLTNQAIPVNISQLNLAECIKKIVEEGNN